MNKPDISVVIPTYNRLDILRVTLQELFAEASQCSREIIVVSDGSNDGTEKYLNELKSDSNIKVIYQNNKGAGAARNAGAAKANADIVLFIDDDMRANPSLLDAHLSCYRHDIALTAVIGRMDFDTRSPKNILSGYVASWSKDFRDQLIENGVTSGTDILSGHFSIRNSVFTNLGGFHEIFTQDGRYGNEDIDFGTRLFNSNNKVTYCDSAVTRQYYRVSSKTKFKQAIDLAVVDTLFSKREATGKQLLQKRIDEVASIENDLIDKFSAQFPRLTYHLFYPIRKITCTLIDSGKNHLIVHQLFGLNQAIAYRFGLSKLNKRQSKLS